MNKIFFVSFFALFIAGCGDLTPPPKAVEKVKSPPTSIPVDGKAIIDFPDKSRVAFDGKIVRDFILENEHGKYQRYVIDLPAEIMAIEGAFFNVMAKSGYLRKIRQEEVGFFLVIYSKKDFPVIRAGYKDHTPKKAGDMTKTRLVLTWKI